MSKIEWTEETWNPLIGCTKVSPGCKNCYAIQTAWIRQHNPKMADRYSGVVEKTAAGALNWTGKVNVAKEAIEKPLRKKKPTMYFVNSMSDLFHEAVPFEVIDQIFAVMALCPQHTFQILTKRPARMVEYFKRIGEDIREVREAAEIIACTDPHLAHVTKKLKGEAKKHIGPIHITSTILPHLKEAGWYWDKTYSGHGKDTRLEYEGEWPLKNIWLGASVENQQTANERIPLLLQVPAAVRFLSCEPLIGPVSFRWAQWHDYNNPDKTTKGVIDGAPVLIYNELDGIKGIHWVIAGGESGSGARPMHPDWVRAIRDQCITAGVSFFFKQHGQWAPIDMPSKQDNIKPLGKNERWMNLAGGHGFHGESVYRMRKVGKKNSGRQLDGREWNEFPVNKTVVNANEDPDLSTGGFDY